MPEVLRKYLTESLDLIDDDVDEVEGPLGIQVLMRRMTLVDPIWGSAFTPNLAERLQSGERLFVLIKSSILSCTIPTIRTPDCATDSS